MENESHSRSSSLPSLDEESEVCYFTRVTLAGGNDVPDVANLQPEPSMADLAASIERTARRIIAENDKSQPEGTDAIEVWSSLLRDSGIELAPRSVRNLLLHFAWLEIIGLRVLNHDQGRCSCTGSVVLDSDTPVCKIPYEPNSADDTDGEPMEPDLMSGEELHEYENSILTGGLRIAPVKPVQPYVTVQDIFECVERALERIIAERYVEEPRPDAVDLREAILNESKGTMELQAASTLICLLACIWGDLIAIRSTNHDRGRCSHHDIVIDADTPGARLETSVNRGNSEGAADRALNGVFLLHSA
jgi:hypothetical protein